MGEKYIPLYRKYRPKNLQEVVGQEHVKTALTNAINLNKISHAYLFTGPRGTGKTSIARILAKSLNCQEGPTLTPCENCPSCIDIKNSNPMDVIEIDAASNRSVEDARNILEKIQYVPTNGKFKIYIIDEVHMLTKEAFNTLLKTLEEPPENVIFILATTEPHKVLETITSRCQRFDFRRITTDDIITHLKHIAKIEKIKIEDDALFTIAKNAAGGMRDSLALLDQVSVLGSEKSITTEDLNKLLGRISFDTLLTLTNEIIDSKPQNAIELLEKIYNSGNEPTQILTNLMGYLKNLLIVKNCDGDELLFDLTQLNAPQIKALKKQCENLDSHQIVFLIEKTIYYIKELKTTTSQHLWLEIAIIDLANLAQNTSLLAFQERLSKLEQGGTTQQFSQPLTVAAPIKPIVEENKKAREQSKEINTEDTKPRRNSELKEEDMPSNSPKLQPTEEQPSPVPASKPAPEAKNDFASLWLNLLQNISSTPTVSLLTQHAMPIEISDEKIIIGCKEPFAKMLSGDSKRIMIEEGAKKLFNKSVNVIIKTASAKDFDKGEKKKLIEETKEKSGNMEDERQGQSSKHPNLQRSEEPDEETDYIEHELAKKNEEKYVPSDQVSMIVKLFDGKYIE